MSHPSKPKDLPMFTQEHCDEIDSYGSLLAKALRVIDPKAAATVTTRRMSALLTSLIDKAKLLLLEQEKLDDVFTTTSSVEILEQDPELSNTIRTACQTGQFSNILDLEILKKPTPSASRQDTPEFDNLHDSFLRPYVGGAVKSFFRYLESNNRNFRESDLRRYYGKFCSIVQSSGTGKSRLLTELRHKGVLVLYMNIRAPSNGYPPRDDIPSGILTENTQCSQEDYTARCCAFFAALFTTVRKELQELDPTHTGIPNVIKIWNDRMSNMGSQDRTKFFTKVKTKYSANLHKIMSERRTDAQNASVVEESESRPRKRIKLDDANVAGVDEKDHEVETPELQGESLLRGAYEKMWKDLPKIFDENDRPQLVIGIDEAHTLNERRFKGPEGFRLSHIICRVINAYSRSGEKSVWVAFVSTTSKVADFSAPQPIYPSHHVAATGELLFPPYTFLGWDQNADPLSKVTANEVARFDHIAGFGRPLWKSLREGHTPEAIMALITQKLCGSHEYGNDQALVVISQRFALDVCLGHPNAVSYIEKGVASHLRVCYSTTEDRTWSFTGYPSEPLTSCAAAWSLHRDSSTLMKTLQVLEQNVHHGMFELGKSGELTSRLLLLLAKDLYVRKYDPSKAAYVLTQSSDGNIVYELVDCRKISVVDFLQHLFGDSFWSEAGGIAKERFKYAYINFSHWVSMDGLISPKSEETRCQPAEWTLRHWHRTCAIQCSHLQPLVDKMIPIYFDDPKMGPDVDRVSQMFISDKAGAKSHERELGFITRTHHSIDCKSPLPFIAILLDLNGPSKSDASFPKKKPSYDETDQCLRICASGVSCDTFPCFPKDVVDLLASLISKPKEPPSDIRLQALIKYGSTADVSHMMWEDQ